jgi:hypothetical protein
MLDREEVLKDIEESTRLKKYMKGTQLAASFGERFVARLLEQYPKGAPPDVYIALAEDQKGLKATDGDDPKPKRIREESPRTSFSCFKEVITAEYVFITY